MSERPPPEGRLLFRFKPPEMSRRQWAVYDIYGEYAVTAITAQEVAPDGWADMPPCVRIIIWGWIEWKSDWEANVSARPVVYELLKRWRDTSGHAPGLSSSAPIGLRLPGEPA